MHARRPSAGAGGSATANAFWFCATVSTDQGFPTNGYSNVTGLDRKKFAAKRGLGRCNDFAVVKA